MLTYYQDILDDTGHIDTAALRCAICGDVIDPVILKNRQSPAPNLLYGTGEKVQSTDEGPWREIQGESVRQRRGRRRTAGVTGVMKE